MVEEYETDLSKKKKITKENKFHDGAILNF
jgi:hypothetical protein